MKTNRKKADIIKKQSRKKTNQIIGNRRKVTKYGKDERDRKEKKIKQKIQERGRDQNKIEIIKEKEKVNT